MYVVFVTCKYFFSPVYVYIARFEFIAVKVHSDPMYAHSLQSYSKIDSLV